MGYCPFFFSKCESQHSKMYCDTGLDRQGLGERPGHAAGARKGAHGQPRYSRLGHDTGHDTAGSARVWPGRWGECSDTKHRIVTGARA